MAYKYEDLEAQALKAIKEHKLYFIEHIIPYLPCAKQTFYDHKLDKSDAIKSAIETNKINAKNKALNKWADSENATLQLAHYKLIADDADRKKLSQTYTDVTTDGEKIQPILVKIIDEADSNRDTKGV